MILDTILVGSYMVNCYITGSNQTKEVLIIDPGANANQIISHIEKQQYKPIGIVLTHGHGDHIGGVVELKSKYDVPIYLHALDQPMVEEGSKNMTKFMFGKSIEFSPDHLLKEEDEIAVDTLTYHILHTPGHTPGGVSIYCENALFTGDTLFQGSIGRTDFPGGSFEQLIHAIKTKLLTYPDDTKVYPGHNSPSTIGWEKKHNPFLK